jgi:hypothetical protein
MEAVSAVRASTPVVILRQKNWCWQMLVTIMTAKSPKAIPIPWPMLVGFSPFAFAAPRALAKFINAW